MAKTDFKMAGKKPDIEINKPGERKFWQRPDFTLILYAVVLFASFFSLPSGRPQNALVLFQQGWE